MDSGPNVVLIGVISGHGVILIKILNEYSVNNRH